MENDKLIDKILNKDHDKIIKLNNEKNIKYLLEKYTKELKSYEYISTLEYFLNNCKNGGYIRYVNMKNEIKWGGILLKIKTPGEDLLKTKYIENENIILVLKNSSNKIYEVDWRKIIYFIKNIKLLMII